MKHAEQAPKGFIVSVLDRLASVKFAVSVVLLITVACIVGTVLPQGAEVARFLARYPEAQARMDLFGTLGLTHIYSAGWFLGLLCVLAASVTVCGSRRFATIRRTSGYARGRAIGSMLTHASFLLILGGGVIRGAWGEKGYLEMREGGTYAQFVGAKGVKELPFALHLVNFEIETYADQIDQKSADPDPNHIVVTDPAKNQQATLTTKLNADQKFGDYSLKVLRYVPDFTMDTSTREVASRSGEPRNPAILVAVAGPNYANHRWLFAKFPDFQMPTKDSKSTGPSPLQLKYVHKGTAQFRPEFAGPIKSFKSTITIVEDDKEVGTRIVEVNSPMAHKGYRFYQSGYNPKDLSYTSLQVVRDPGVPVVYAGFTLMMAGLFVVFYLNPWLEARRKQA